MLLCVRTFKLISLSVNGFPDTDICADDWSCIGPERRQKTTDDYSHISFYSIPSSEFNAYLKQIKVILSAVKKYRIFSLVMNTIFIFSL